VRPRLCFVEMKKRRRRLVEHELKTELINRQQDTISEAGIGLNKVRRVSSVGVATERNTLDWSFNLQSSYQKGTRRARDAECLGTTPPPTQYKHPQVKTLSRLGNANSKGIFQTRVYGSLRRERILVQSISAAGKTALRFYRCRGD